MDNHDLKKRIQHYWDERPCNIRHSSAPQDSYAYSREVTLRKYTAEPHIRYFANHPAWYRCSVLDMGCGIGTDSLEFGRNGAFVTAMDMSAASLEVLEKRIRAENLTQWVTPYLGDIENLVKDMPGVPFDLVYSFGVLHHTPNPLKALCDAYQVAGRKAELRIMVYHRYSWKAFWILATYGKFQFWKWAELLQRYSEAQEGSPLTRTYTRKSVKKLVEAAGWKVTKMEVAHIFPYRIADYRRGELVKEWYWRYMPSRLFAWLERVLGWHLLIWARK